MAADLVAIDVFGDAAREADLVDRAAQFERVEPQQPGAPGLGRTARHRREQAVGHERGERAGLRLVEHVARRERQSRLRRDAPTRVFDADDAARCVEHEQPRADVERGERGDPPVLAQRKLRRAPADIDIQDALVPAQRARHRARAIGRHGGLEPVAGADRDQLPGLAREQLADGAGVAAPYRDACEDERAAVDRVGRNTGQRVLALDERAERRRVDRLFVGVGREQDVGLEERLARGDDISRVEPFQHDAREHQVRGRRPDIDADAGEPDLVVERQRPTGIGEENPAFALVHCAPVIQLGSIRLECGRASFDCAALRSG